MVPNPACRAIGQLPEQPKIDRVSVLFRFRDRPITIPDLTTLVSQDSSFKARNELVAVSIKARMNSEKADTISTTRYNSPSKSVRITHRFVNYIQLGTHWECRIPS